MTFSVDFPTLLDYTEWERGQWETWFKGQDAGALAVDLGPNSDGRIANVGELVRHIVSAELRYTQRIRGIPVSDTVSVAADDVPALFAFGRQTRAGLRALLAELPTERWDVPQEIQLGPSRKLTVTPKKMVVQSVTHELRHWAQIATLLRMSGRKPGPRDFLVSPLLD